VKFTNQQTFFDYIKTLKLLAAKDLGQNFLINDNLAKTIVDKLDVKSDEKVLEIGAGFGSLSYFLVAQESEVVLLDVDPKTIMFLNEQFGQQKHVNIVQESILKHDLSSYHKIIGNLPYYITNDSIEYCLLNAKKCRRMIFMIQKEVFPRLNAKPSQEDFGPLSLLISYLGNVRRIFNVGRSNFVPAPRIDSIVVEIEMNSENDYEMAEKLMKTTKKLFHHRRKTIRNNLRLFLNDVSLADHALADLGVDASKRPEQLDLPFYLALIKQLKF
jgi:16S rRNA (adenine1518-N6/adenine1519-N6)-dimethyltransferase